MSSSTTARLSEKYHDQITEMAESSDKSIQEVMDSILEDALEDRDPDSLPADAIGRCPYTGQIYTERDVGEYGLIDRERCVKPDVPSRIPVEELEPVGV